MSLLTIIQNVATDLALDEPTTVIGNSNSQVKQLLRLANREGKDLASRYGWQVLTRQNSFTLLTGGAKNQGAMNGTIVTDSDFDYIYNDTFWNQTLNRPMIGPLSPVEIETVESSTFTGPNYMWYILGGDLYIDPGPTIAETCQFQYKSTFWCESSGGTGQAAWAADTDVAKLDESLLELGIIWRWLRRKGMDYAEEFATYEKRVMDAIARDGGKPRIDMNGGVYGKVPGIFVPSGNWNIP
jgi:hypothetical protein